MKANEMIIDTRDRIPSSIEKRVKLLSGCIGIGILLILVTLALAAATLAIVNKRLTTTTTTTTPSPPTTVATTTPTTITTATTLTTTTTDGSKPSLGSEYADAIKITDVMAHLNELQRLATISNGTRAVNTPGFNRTLDYIDNYLRSHTDFAVKTTFFYLRNFVLASVPTLTTSINGVIKNRTFSTNISAAEFYFVQYSRPANFPDYASITVIPNLGCSDEDWRTANPPPAGQVVLVKRGDCNFADKADFALKYNVNVLLLYNDGTASDRIQPIYISLGQNNELPALFLSYTLGQELADAAKNSSNNAGVRINIALADERRYPVGNICADTPTGTVTQTIVIGSHSDGVPAGPGINDNGSGSAANLGLAVALARLFQTSTYAKYKYRVRFCWWGAEEIGLLGSNDHVQQAMNSTTVGERLSDYLINLNYDMLGSPNYIFGIYDGNTTNVAAFPGSRKITALFKEWFEKQKLPWDYTDFSGRSDYGPFLAQGIVAGGLFSGADERKTREQRDRYDQLLGQGMGGIVGAIQDPCYHQSCDSIQNINVFAYEKMVQAAAYILEFIARQNDLEGWLYPNGKENRLSTQTQDGRKYNSINEYFNLPYL